MREAEDEGNMLACLGSSTSVVLIELLVEIPELVKNLSDFERAKPLSSRQYKTVLVEANENKER